MPRANPVDPLHAALGALILGAAAGMIAAYFWAFDRLRAGRPLLPEGSARIPPWGWRTVSVVLIAYVAVNVATAESYRAVRQQVGLQPPAEAPAKPTAPEVSGKPVVVREGPPLSFTEQMLLVSVINLAVLVLIPVVVRGLSGATWVDLGLTGAGASTAVRAGALAFFLVTPAVYAINGVALLVFRAHRHPLEMMLRTEMSPFGIALAFVSAAVLAPAAEELLFRGVVQAWLSRVCDAGRSKALPPLDFDWPDVDTGPDPFAPPPPSATGPPAHDPRPVVLTSALFALVHAPQMPAPIPIFALSVALGLLYQRTGNLLAPFTLHAMFNAFSTTLAVAALSQ